MNSLFAEFRERADFRLVYIAEAHATDEWPIASGRYTADGEAVCLTQPRNADERRAAAQAYVEAYGIALPVLVDPPPEPAAQQIPGAAEPQAGKDGEFEARFAPWPLRFWGCEVEPAAGGEGAGAWVMRYIASPTQCEYDLSELRRWLMDALDRQADADADAGAGAGGGTEVA